MGEHKFLTGRDLARMTPRQLEEAAEERDIELPLRWDSAIARQLLWDSQEGGPGTITTESGVPTGGLPAAAADPAKVVGKLAGAEKSVGPPGEASSYEDLKLPQLKKVAAERGVEVEGSGKKGAVTKKDVVEALNQADAPPAEAPAGGETSDSNEE